ncbi:tRNA (guanine(26)-N(2))-dimethyltransferase [Tanacetum coccineum]
MFRNIIAVFGSSSTTTVRFGRTSTGSGVTKKELAPRPSDMKEKTSKRVHSVRRLIKEVAGFAPCERRITELLKVGKDKRSLKLAKRNSQEGKEEERGDVQRSSQDEKRGSQYRQQKANNVKHYVLEVDLDPYGLPSVFLDSASHANRYKRYVVPVLSVHMDFYAHVFVRIYTSAGEMKNTPLKLSYVYQCVGCDSFHLQPLARTVFKESPPLEAVDQVLGSRAVIHRPWSRGCRSKIVLVTDMDPDELQSDLLALRRVYCLLINDEDVLSMTSLEVNLTSIKPGTTVTIKWCRN